MITRLATSVCNALNYGKTRSAAFTNEQRDGRINEHTKRKGRWGEERSYLHTFCPCGHIPIPIEKLFAKAPSCNMQDFSPSDPWHGRLMKYVAQDSGCQINVSAWRCWHGRSSHQKINWSHVLASVTLMDHSCASAAAAAAAAKMTTWVDW